MPIIKGKKKTKNVPKIKSKTKPRAPSKVAIPRAVVQQICGVTDPFCSHARGAKIPDPSATRTLPYTFHGRHTLSTDAAGNANLLWHPQYAYGPLTGPSASVDNVVSAWNDFPAFGLLADVDEYRIVSSGFILRGISAPLSAAGMVFLRSWPRPNGTGYGALDLQSYNASSSLDIPLRDVREVCTVTQRSARVVQEFTILTLDTGTVVNFVDNGYCPVTIAISGGPLSVGALDIEYFINYELIFNDGSGNSQLTTNPAPPSALITAASAKITASATSFVKEGVKNLGNMIVHKATAAVASYLGVPPALAMSG